MVLASDSQPLQALIDFIQASPTPFHVVTQMADVLETKGFEVLDESAVWDLQPGKCYFLTRNDSSIIAFKLGDSVIERGFRMVGAHTDSPNLKVKPNPDIHSQGYWQLGVETYGGVLLNPWFDRPLALAGKVTVLDQKLDQQENITSVMVDTEQAVGVIPSLAIHLDREANKSRSINAQTDLPVMMSLDPDKTHTFKTWLLELVKEQYPDLSECSILDYEMSFYEADKGSVFGVNQEFVSASRLDNLLSCYVGLQSLLASESDESILLVCNDHEEVGSQSAAGADGSMLEQCLKRIAGSEENYSRMIASSMMISADNAHGVHPNFSSKHDNNHGPLLNAGPVIKINANQRYASNSETQAIFRHCCEEAKVPVQSFVVRTDMACGSTIGPMTAANLGVKTVDVGIPTFAMHSIREMAGSNDMAYLIEALKVFFAKSSV